MITITNATNVHIPTNDGKEIFVKSAKRVIISNGQVTISKGKRIDRCKYEKNIRPRELKPLSCKEPCLRIYNISKNTSHRDLQIICSMYGKATSFEFIKGCTTNKCFIKGDKKYLDCVSEFLYRHLLDNQSLIVVKS